MSFLLPSSGHPYLLRAVHEWCIDQGLTPYLHVDASSPMVKVPRPFVKNNEIVLNVSYDATGNFNISNDMVSFQARFSGVVQTIEVPLENVISLTAKETGEGVYLQQLRALQNMFQDDDASKEIPARIATSEKSKLDDLPEDLRVLLDKFQSGNNQDESEDPPPTPTKGFHLKRIK